MSYPMLDTEWDKPLLMRHTFNKLLPLIAGSIDEKLVMRKMLNDNLKIYTDAELQTKSATRNIKNLIPKVWTSTKSSSQCLLNRNPRLRPSIRRVLQDHLYQIVKIHQILTKKLQSISNLSSPNSPKAMSTSHTSTANHAISNARSSLFPFS